MRGPAHKGAQNPKPGKWGTGPGQPPQSKPNSARDRGRTRGGALTAWYGPTGAQHRSHATCACHTDPGREEGRGRRESASARTHKGHTGEGQGSEPREPGGLRQQAGVCHEGPPTRTRWGGYHLAQPGDPPGAERRLVP